MLRQQQEPKQEPMQEPKLLELVLQLELVLEQQLLLFYRKQPKQQPTGRSSTGIFSWVFLK